MPDLTSIRAAGGRGLSLTSVKDASGPMLPNVAVERQQPSPRSIRGRQEAMKWPRWQDGTTGDKPVGEAKASWNIHQSGELRSHDELGTSLLIFRCAARAAARLA